jgi:hypothetical protein
VGIKDKRLMSQTKHVVEHLNHLDARCYPIDYCTDQLPYTSSCRKHGAISGAIRSHQIMAPLHHSTLWVMLERSVPPLHDRLRRRQQIVQFPAHHHLSVYQIQRLSWAGIQVTVGAASLFIDPIGTTVANSLGQPDIPLLARTPSRHALLTHAHTDHYDPVALQAILGEQGHVICHQSIAGLVAQSGLHIQGVQLYEPVVLEWLSGDFVATASR